MILGSGRAIVALIAVLGVAAPSTAVASHAHATALLDRLRLDGATGLQVAERAFDHVASITGRGAVWEEKRNLTDAETLVAHSFAGGSRFDRVLHAVEVAMSRQTAALGLQSSKFAPLGYRRLSVALRTIGKHSGVLVKTSDIARVRTVLRSLPPGHRAPVIDTLNRFAALQRATIAAYASVDAGALEERANVLLQHEVGQARDAAGILNRMLSEFAIDLTDVISARSHLVRSVKRLRPLSPAARRAPCDAVVVAPVLALDTTGGDCRYKHSVALSIDVGGKDTYLNNAGGTNLVKSDCYDLTNRPGGVSAFVDLAGKDVYGDPETPANERPICGYNGGGFMGVGLLLDTAGRDTYAGGAVSTNGGGGNAGLGLLVDVAGNDSYEAASFGTNGGSNAGAGLMVDGGGNDLYVATDWGVNGGGYGGLGEIADLGGDDVYEALRIGANGGAWLGSGRLFDLTGDDVYRAVESGSNGGANLGTGFVFDAAGDDRYRARGGGTNGGAWGAGAGAIVDVEGDDSYVAHHVAVNGGGGFNASGFLIDLAGDDSYAAGDLGSNGGATFLGATGFLLDSAGNDVYTAGNRGANGGGDVGLAALIDLGGTDRYKDRQGGTGRDRTVAPKGRLGAQLDRS